MKNEKERLKARTEAISKREARELVPAQQPSEAGVEDNGSAAAGPHALDRRAWGEEVESWKELIPVPGATRGARGWRRDELYDRGSN